MVSLASTIPQEQASSCKNSNSDPQFDFDPAGIGSRRVGYCRCEEAGYLPSCPDSRAGWCRVRARIIRAVTIVLRVIELFSLVMISDCSFVNAHLVCIDDGVFIERSRFSTWRLVEASVFDCLLMARQCHKQLRGSFKRSFSTRTAVIG